MNVAEFKVWKALDRDLTYTPMQNAVDGVLQQWLMQNSPVEWEEAIVRLADALIAESKGE